MLLRAVSDAQYVAVGPVAKSAIERMVRAAGSDLRERWLLFLRASILTVGGGVPTCVSMA